LWADLSRRVKQPRKIERLNLEGTQRFITGEGKILVERPQAKIEELLLLQLGTETEFVYEAPGLVNPVDFQQLAR
jgi:hypothetical protein